MIIQVSNAESWFRDAKTSCFGLVLPDGWFGRPYDNQHVLDDYRVNENEVFFRFDKLREVQVTEPKVCRIEIDSSGAVNGVRSPTVPKLTPRE